MTKQSFKKLAANLSILILLTVCLLAISSPKKAWAFLWQSHQKTITKYEHRSMPLHFEKVKHGGKLLDMRPGQESQESRAEVEGNDDWLRGLTVSFKNTSGKNIVYFRMLLIFPETEATGYPMTFPMVYGRMPKDSGDRNFESVLKPEEEVELSLTSERHEKLRGFLKGRSHDKVSEVRLFLDEAAFDDDLMWFGGSLARRDPNDPNNWIHIQ